jgi:hypothetical protein
MSLFFSFPLSLLTFFLVMIMMMMEKFITATILLLSLQANSTVLGDRNPNNDVIKTQFGDQGGY